MDFGSTTGIRSPFSPRVRQSITGRRPLSSAKNTPSKFLESQDTASGDIIYKTPSCTVETYGMPLPVMVTETLTFASGDVSVRLSACGWCWLVAGRRVLAWPREPPAPAGPSSPAQASPAAARELTLPQTDLAHKADLVVIFYEDGAQMPSCMGVSPEGMVRYWPSVGQEGVYVDVSTELAGQECEKLGENSRAGFVLATTTCTVVLLTPAVVEGVAGVGCRTLRAPSGWLGGLGRRVSLLFFGALPPQPDTKLVGAVVVEPGVEEEEACVALVAGGGGGGGPLLQLWRGAALHGHCLRRALHHHQLLPHHGEAGGAEITALDVRAGGPNALLLLVAASSGPRAPDLRYAIAHVCVAEAASPLVRALVPLRAPAPAAPDPPLRLLPLPDTDTILLYCTNYIALLPSTGGGAGDKAEFVDVGREGDAVWSAAAAAGGGALVFSRRHGVLRLRPRRAPAPPAPPPAPHVADDSLALYDIDPHEVSAVTTDACGKLKTAFLFHLRRDTAACRALLAELFPAPASAPAPDDAGDVDALLDRTVLKIATEILDDIPAGDPRWKQRVTGQAANIALGSSGALEIAAQLRDKQRAFALFMEFLRAAGLTQRLHQITDESDGVVKSTLWALCACGEQLAAAAALRELHRGPHGPLIDAAIYQVVCGEGGGGGGEEEAETEAALASGALSPADVCYRRVSRIARVLRALAATNSLDVVIAVVSAMAGARAQWRGAGPPPPPALLPALLDLHKRTFTQYLGACSDAASRGALLEAAATLSELMLASATALPPHHYRRLRTQLILPFVEEGQIERAAALAEKFKDFELLIQMCVSSNDIDRLYGYIDKYINEGMLEQACAWLSERGGRRALLIRALGTRYPARLVSWLSAAPQPPRPALLALQQLAGGAPRAAAAAYAALAQQETDSVARMTTMASIAKLCLIASDDDQPTDLWNKIENRLALSEQHAALPRDIRVHNGLDAEDTRVLPPEDLVQMYIESESRSLTEYDYKKALDLTDYIDDVERRDELRLRVWCACLRRDDWSSCRVEAPADELRDKTFFRLLDLVHVMGGDLEVLLPSAEELLSARELEPLAGDPRFRFLVKFGYECLAATDQ